MEESWEAGEMKGPYERKLTKNPCWSEELYDNSNMDETNINSYLDKTHIIP